MKEQGRLNLVPRTSPHSIVRRTKADGWHLQIPPGDDRAYRLAQVDDYSNLRRAKLPYMPELKFNIRARCSSENIPGTWGFGLWNDPFSIRVMPNVEILRLPALPNAAWFFFASSHNYLSIRDDLPAEGSLMATFRSPKIPPLMLTLAVLGLPLLLLPPIARMVRRAGRLLVQQGAALLSHNPTDWHEYGLEWRSRAVAFELDGERVFETQVSPNPPLGLVIWVDNQYAAALPNGRIRYGRLANQEPAWVEVDQIEVLRSL